MPCSGTCRFWGVVDGCQDKIDAASEIVSRPGACRTSAEVHFLRHKSWKTDFIQRCVVDILSRNDQQTGAYLAVEKPIIDLFAQDSDDTVIGSDDRVAWRRKDPGRCDNEVYMGGGDGWLVLRTGQPRSCSGPRRVAQKTPFYGSTVNSLVVDHGAATFTIARARAGRRCLRQLVHCKDHTESVGKPNVPSSWVDEG